MFDNQTEGFVTHSQVCDGGFDRSITKFMGNDYHNLKEDIYGHNRNAFGLSLPIMNERNFKIVLILNI